MSATSHEVVQAAVRMAEQWAGEDELALLLSVSAAARAARAVSRKARDGAAPAAAELESTVEPSATEPADSKLAAAAERFADRVASGPRTGPDWERVFREAQREAARFEVRRESSRPRPDLQRDPHFLRSFRRNLGFVATVLSFEGETLRDRTPEVVRISFNGSGQTSCSGVVLGTRYVLTAAHCIEGTPDDITVQSFSSWDETGLFRLATEFCQIPIAEGRHVPLPNGPDLALFRLEEDHFDGVPLQGLPDSALTESLPAGLPLVAVGYGRTTCTTPAGGLNRSKPMFALPLDRCTTHDCDDLAGEIICRPGTEFVAGVGDDEGGICEGDSGGPVYLWSHQEPWQTRRLVGLNARAYGLQCCGHGGYFTRLDGEAGSWIRQTIANWPG